MKIRWAIAEAGKLIAAIRDRSRTLSSRIISQSNIGARLASLVVLGISVFYLAFSFAEFQMRRNLETGMSNVVKEKMNDIDEKRHDYKTKFEASKQTSLTLSDEVDLIFLYFCRLQ